MSGQLHAVATLPPVEEPKRAHRIRGWVGPGDILMYWREEPLPVSENEPRPLTCSV